MINIFVILKKKCQNQIFKPLKNSAIIKKFIPTYYILLCFFAILTILLQYRHICSKLSYTIAEQKHNLSLNIIKKEKWFCL